MNAIDSRVYCERCHGIGSDDPAGKIFWLTTRLDVIDLKTNRVATEGAEAWFRNRLAHQTTGRFGIGPQLRGW